MLTGQVESNGAALSGYQVTLYASFSTAQGPHWEALGSGTSNTGGNFTITYPRSSLWPSAATSVLVVEATKDSVMLVSAIGAAGQTPPRVMVNELTTVATGTAFAQFVHNAAIRGNSVGVVNAAKMVTNFVDPATGLPGKVITSEPNGTDTSTYATFNSLANAVAGCVNSADDCQGLFTAANTSDPTATTQTVLDAIATITKHPSFVDTNGDVAATDPLFTLSQDRPVYTPALTAAPTNWLLFLKITGGFYSAQDSSNLMNGPGNFAIDARGNAWVLDNYIPQAPADTACTGRTLLEFTPWGANAPGSPFVGGGLAGAGYGITFDPNGVIWIGNFGFQDPPCASTAQAATNNSISVFLQNGEPLSPPNGFTQGNISWPQGTVSDRAGNIWVASCGNDSVTKIPNGNPDQARNIPLGPIPAPVSVTDGPQIRPFGIVIDAQGYAWVTGNHSDTMLVISRDGTVETLPGTFNQKTVLSHPVGDAVDSKGNVWVSNSDWLDVPCPTATRVGTATHPSLTVYAAGQRKPYQSAPFTGGGLTVPWGIAVDGNDTVWAFNFGAAAVGIATTTATGISHFCGMNTANCPAGMPVGGAISPSTGYRSDALIRITGGQIDPSGNIWVTGNWKIDANPDQNPGGNSIAIVVGAAAPVQTPLIGPPVPFWH